MNYKGIALFCDLHRVLLHEGREILPEDRAALERFQAAGGRFGVIADYSATTVRPMLQGVPTNTWSVVLGGAEAYRFDTRTVAFPRVISQLSMAAFLQQVIGTLPEVSILLYSESRLFCLTDPELLEHRFRHGKPPYDVVRLEIALRFPWLGVRFFGPQASRDTLERMADSWGIYDLADCIHDEPGSSTFVPHGANKARCLGDLHHLDELRDKKMIVVAASQQDSPCLAIADLPIAAPDADPEVRDSAKIQIPPEATASLAWVIDHVLPTL